MHERTFLVTKFLKGVKGGPRGAAQCTVVTNLGTSKYSKESSIGARLGINRLLKRSGSVRTVASSARVSPPIDCLTFSS